MGKTNRRTFMMGSAMLAASLPLATKSVLAQDATPTADQGALEVVTRVRFAQVDTDVSKVEVAVNNDTKEEEFKYGESSDWHDVDPGGVRITISADRAGFNYWIYDGYYPMAAGNSYQMVISPVVVFTSIVDESPTKDGMARVGFIHASVDTPAIDIAGADGTVLVSDVSYGYISKYVEVPEGTVSFSIQATGTTDVAVSVADMALTAGTVYDFVLYGDPGDDDKPVSVMTMTTPTKTS